MRRVAALLYWLAALTITLGAYGHGFQGVKPVRAAIAASTLPPDIVRVLWMVWYFVSGCMVVFGVLLMWAWRGLAAGPESRSAVALLIGAFYAVVGVTCWLYSGRDPFWLLFLVQGVLVIGSTLALGARERSAA